MNKKHQWVAVCFAAACIITGNLFLSSCQPGQIFGPTATQTPTVTKTSTPSPTPTVTPDPVGLAMDDASRFWAEGKSEQAISAYQTALEKSDDAAVRALVLNALKDIGNATMQQAESVGTTNMEEMCKFYGLSYSAYRSILTAKDRPTFESDPFSIDAAKVDLALADCQFYDTPQKTHSEMIHILLEHLAIYPAEPEIQDLFIPDILFLYRSEVTSDYQDHFQMVLDDGQAIIETVGQYQAGDKNVTSIIRDILMREDLCSGNPIRATDLGTSTIKKIFSCDPYLEYSLEQAGLLAAEESEIWFILKNEYKSQPSVQCRGFYTTKGYYFTYSYQGRQDQIYYLINAHSGKQVSSKTFMGTAPKCVFTSCSLNEFTKTATCTGGEGQAVFDENILLDWLKIEAR